MYFLFINSVCSESAGITFSQFGRERCGFVNWKSVYIHRLFCRFFGKRAGQRSGYYRYIARIYKPEKHGEFESDSELHLRYAC